MGSNEVVENIKDFILGGNAEFTLLQEKSERSKRTIQVKYRVKANNNRSCWFVYTETDNGKMLYRGFLRPDLSFELGKKGRENLDKDTEYYVNALLWVLNRKGSLPSEVHIYHHGRCSVCGRKLTDAESLRCGIGPTCRKKIGGR